MESEEQRLQFVSDRIEALVREFGAEHDPAIREKAEELVRLLMELYGAGLNRMLEIVDASDNVATESLFDRFASDALISNLLVLHGLHPHNLETRMRRALDRVETAFAQKSGWIQLVEVRDDVAFVRVNAPSRVAGIKGAIDRALRDAAPELTFVDIEATPSQPRSGAYFRFPEEVLLVTGQPSAGPLSKLQRFLRPAPKPRAGEACEFCSEAIPDEHSHVVNIETRSLLCVCRACGFLFTHEGAAGGKYKAVPERYLRLVGAVLGAERWESLQIPVNMAFLFRNSTMDRVVAFYPGPAGATESLLPVTAWQELVQDQPVLESVASDVEAFLVYRRRDGEFECYIVPIDACYELVGRIRRCWRGFDGGQDAWDEIDAFFASVRKRSDDIEVNSRVDG